MNDKLLVVLEDNYKEDIFKCIIYNKETKKEVVVNSNGCWNEIYAVCFDLYHFLDCKMTERVVNKYD